MSLESLKAQFEKDGYLILRNFVKPEEAIQLKDEYLRIVQDCDEAEFTQIFTTDDSQTDKHDSYFLE